MTSEPAPGEAPDHVPAEAAGDAPGDVRATAPSAEAISKRRLHPAATVIDALHHARTFAFAFIAIIASGGLARGGLIIGVLIIGASAAAVINWRTTRYWVIDHTLHLSTGLISRKQQVIPASRISALDTSRGILQQLFGVVAVQVQTAGGNKKGEIALRAVTFREAERLREALGHRQEGTSVPAPAGTSIPAAGQSQPVYANRDGLSDQAPVVFSMTIPELWKQALTSPSIAVAGAAGAAIYSAASDALPDTFQRDLANSANSLSPTTGAIVVLAVLVLAAAVSVIGTTLMYWDFTVTNDDRRLRVTRGLLTQRVGTIPIDRIHGVRVRENWLRQALGYASIEVEVAGYAGQDEVVRTLIPLVRRDEVPALLERVVPLIRWPEQPLQPIPARARRRYLTLPLLLSLPVAVGLLFVPADWVRVLAVIPPMIALAYGMAAASAAGWDLSADTLTLRWRTLDRSTLLATSHRLQRAEQFTNPFQRRAALASFGVRLSNRQAARVRHLDEHAVHALLARTGHRET